MKSTSFKVERHTARTQRKAEKRRAKTKSQHKPPPPRSQRQRAVAPPLPFFAQKVFQSNRRKKAA